MSARTIQQTNADEKLKIELVGRSEGDTEFYVEGVHGMNISGPVLKLNFYTLGIDSTPAAQRRESVCRIAMGAPQFFGMVDFLNQVATQMRQTAAQAQAPAQVQVQLQPGLRRRQTHRRPRPLHCRRRKRRQEQSPGSPATGKKSELSRSSIDDS